MRSLIYETPGLETSDEKHAPTDLYSVERRVSRVQYLLLLIVGFIVTGVLAVMLAGFLGYNNCTLPLIVNGQPQTAPGGGVLCWHDAWSGNGLYLQEPWPLYLWFSGLMIVLLISILRSKEMRSRLIATLILSVASIAVVAYVYLYGQGKLIKEILSLLYSPWTYFIVNFGLLLIFVGNVVWRWVTYVRKELIPARRQEEQLKTADPNESQRLSRRMRRENGERASGDLMAGMLLCAILALVFTPVFIGGALAGIPAAGLDCGSFLAWVTGSGQHGQNNPWGTYPTDLFKSKSLHITLDEYRQDVLNGSPAYVYYNSDTDNLKYASNACPVSPKIQVGPVLPGPLHNIAATDFLLAVLCFIPGIYLLAVTAFNKGLRVLEEPAELASQAAAEPELKTGRTGDTERSVVIQVAQAVSDTLLFALRQLIPYMRRVLISLRNILWPALILIASFSFALCSRFIQYYLHNFDPTNKCTNVNSLAASCQAPDTHIWLWLAIVSGLVGLLCTIFSVALLFVGTEEHTFTSRRVVPNTLQFLGRIGVVLLLTFWMFSFALFGFNWFLLDTGIVPKSLALPAPQSNALCSNTHTPTWQIMLAPPHPACAQPFGLGWVSAVSFAALIVAVVLLLLRLRRGVISPVGARTSAPTTGGAATGTTS